MSRILGKILLVLGLALLFAVPVFAQWTAALALSARPSDVLAPSQAMTLTILHTNDFHAHVDEWGDGIAGSARIATKVDEIRAAKDNVLLLDAGDQFQGTLFYNLFKADIITLTMNEIGYDAMTIGNHEFDDGPAELARLIDGADFPIVSANIDASAEPGLAGKIHPSTVITVAGEPIGIVGLTSPDTAELSSPGDVVFLGTVTSMQDAVGDLTAQGIDKIIALTHQGYSYDVELAEAVQDVDVIVGGHSHTYLGEGYDNPYPTIVNNVLIVQAGEWGEYLGHLDVVFDEGGEVITYTGAPIYMDTSIAKTQAVEDIVAARRGAIEDLKATNIGTTTVDLLITVSGQRICRMGECRMGNLVSDAMLWKMNDMVSEPYDIAIQNGGGLRAPIYAGLVSVGDVLEVLPFGNAIGTFEITGTHILAALENGVGQVEYGAGRFPQVSGMRYEFNLSQPVGSRILAAEVYNADMDVFEALDEEKVYRVVTNDYMLNGGDGYSMFADHAIDPYDKGPLLDAAVVEYFEEFSPVTPEIEGRAVSVVVPPSLVEVFGPGSGLAGTYHTYQANVTPSDASTPLTYTWEATDIAPITRTAGLTDTQDFMWDDPGAKSITVTARNSEGVVSGTTTINITPLDIEFGKAVAPSGDVAGGSILRYTLAYTNSQDAIIRDAVITDTIPDNTTFDSVEDGGMHTDGIVRWELPDIAAESSGVVHFSVQVDEGLTPGTTITNVAHFNAPATDPVSSNEVANDIAVKPYFGLSRKYATGGATVAPGQLITYTIVYTNSGTETGYGVTISDPLPDYVDHVTGGALSVGTVTFDVGAVDVDASGEVSFTVRVDVDAQSGSRIENQATIDSNQTEPVQTNLVSQMVSGPSLTLHKAVTPQDTVTPGDLLTYTLTYTNAGTDAATGVTIEDMIPPGTRYHAGDHVGDMTTLRWDIGALAAGAHGQITFSVQALGGVVNVINQAAIQSAQQEDWIWSNVVTSTVETQAVDVRKSASPVDTVQTGAQIVYTLTYQNPGDSTLDDVTIVDPLPAGVTYQSGGTYIAATRSVSYPLGAIAPQQTGAVSFTVKVDAPIGEIVTNTASVFFEPYYPVRSSPDPLDIAGVNNFAPLGGSTSLRRYVAQSFIASAPLVDRLGAYVYGNGAPYPALSVQLWGDDQGTPDSTSVLLQGETVTPEALGQRYFAQAVTPLRLTVGERYWMVIEFDTQSAGSAGVRYAEGDLYPEGEWRYSDDDGATWDVPGPGASTDMNVRVEYIPPPRSNLVAHTVVTAPTCLTVSPTTLGFSAVLDSTDPAPKALHIDNCALGAVEWTATNTQAWLEISPTTGIAPATLNVMPRIDGLGLGTYTDTITMQGGPDTQNSPQEVQVRLTIGTGTVYLPLVIRNWPPTPGAPVLNAITPPGASPSYLVDWDPVSRAESYTLEQATASDFSDAEVIYDGSDTSYEIASEGIAHYHYRVRAHNQFGAGDWSNIQSVEVRWEKEPNEDAKTQANGPLVSGVTYYGLFPADDIRDYFYFDLSTAHSVELWLTNIAVGQDYDVYLRDANLDGVGSSAKTGNVDEHILIDNLTPGRYYIHLDNFGKSGSTQPYHLRVVYE